MRQTGAAPAHIVLVEARLRVLRESLLTRSVMRMGATGRDTASNDGLLLLRLVGATLDLVLCRCRDEREALVRRNRVHFVIEA